MDRVWAASFLRQAAESGRGDPQGFVTNVLAGLEIGRRQYGDHAYHGRDNAREGLMEARDAAAYALMDYDDMENDLAAGAEEDGISNARMLLGEAVTLAARLDLVFKLARQARRDAQPR